MRYSFCKAGDRKAGNAGSGTEWGREPGSNLDIAGETWMILKIGSHHGHPRNRDLIQAMQRKHGWTVYCSICLSSGSLW
ncbi:hypothetical protein [Sphingobacterium multivorum]|uniref:hypothetical protein n=1 Tax=Sphingobacterium multivorum TaxID=28454 RepID=UPI0028ABF905|nr:hypothetical protein [Sphingobacterium multivorum]